MQIMKVIQTKTKSVSEQNKKKLTKKYNRMGSKCCVLYYLLDCKFKKKIEKLFKNLKKDKEK